MKANLVKVVQRWKNRALVEGFERWREQAQGARRLKGKALKVVQRLMIRALVEGFERWRNQAEGARRMKAKALKAVQRLMNRALVEGFERWRDSVVEERQMWTKALKALACWRTRKLGWVWNQWSAYLDYRHWAQILGRRRETFSSRRFSQIKYNILEMFRINGRLQRMTRTNVKSRCTSLFGKFVLGLEAQRVSVRRMVSAQNYANACLESKVYGAWHSWFEAHKNNRIKVHLGYERVSAKYVQRITLRNWNLWQQHRDDLVNPILRRFERLAKRSLMKVASDVMPELLQAEVTKAMTKVLLGPLLGPMGPEEGLSRKSILENAFNTWSKRQPAFKSAISLRAWRRNPRFLNPLRC